jgi:hypothetical protein
MHDPYDDDEDGYDDEYYNYDYGAKYNLYKFFFTFDVGNTPLSGWLEKMIKDTFDSQNISGFPVNSWNPNTANDKKFQYLGSNYAGEVIWKSNYWVIDPINQEYKAHLQSNAGYFVQQPNYYKGLFDILN